MKQGASCGHRPATAGLKQR